MRKPFYIGFRDTCATLSTNTCSKLLGYACASQEECPEIVCVPRIYSMVIACTSNTASSIVRTVEARTSVVTEMKHNICSVLLT